LLEVVVRLCQGDLNKQKYTNGRLKKMGRSKMGRYWSTKEEWKISTLWKKICKFFKKKVPEVCPTCKSHTDERVAKGECCQTKKSSR